MHRLMLLIAIVLLLSGCAEDVLLRHPSTGQVATCKGGYRTTGLGGLVDQTAKELQMRCLDDYQRQCYQRIPE